MGKFVFLSIIIVCGCSPEKTEKTNENLPEKICKPAVTCDGIKSELPPGYTIHCEKNGITIKTPSIRYINKNSSGPGKLNSFSSDSSGPGGIGNVSIWIRILERTPPKQLNKIVENNEKAQKQVPECKAKSCLKENKEKLKKAGFKPVPEYYDCLHSYLIGYLYVPEDKNQAIVFNKLVSSIKKHLKRYDQKL
ncbi:hypothetical protein KKF34_00450 [Myxococcota bacterium]|nr:hypothetical protein [Myxococcota bacterium]MBU1382027.1 hypothetical protein [Myxococcota bacterium]MBU1495331.1 hypothetical protein [Myxococcota bacterium]